MPRTAAARAPQESQKNGGVKRKLRTADPLRLLVAANGESHPVRNLTLRSSVGLGQEGDRTRKAGPLVGDELKSLSVGGAKLA